MTNQNQSTQPVSLFSDSIILVFKGQLQLEVEGGEKDASRFIQPWRHKARMTKDGRVVRFNGRAVLFAQVVTAEEKARKAAKAAVEAEAEQKANPNPGRKPRLITPSRPH